MNDVLNSQPSCAADEPVGWCLRRDVKSNGQQRPRSPAHSTLKRTHVQSKSVSPLISRSLAYCSSRTTVPRAEPRTRPHCTATRQPHFPSPLSLRSSFVAMYQHQVHVAPAVPNYTYDNNFMTPGEFQPAPPPQQQVRTQATAQMHLQRLRACLHAASTVPSRSLAFFVCHRSLSADSSHCAVLDCVVS